MTTCISFSYQGLPVLQVSSLLVNSATCEFYFYALLVDTTCHKAMFFFLPVFVTLECLMIPQGTFALCLSSLPSKMGRMSGIPTFQMILGRRCQQDFETNLLSSTLSIHMQKNHQQCVWCRPPCFGRLLMLFVVCQVLQLWQRPLVVTLDRIAEFPSCHGVAQKRKINENHKNNN